MEIVPIARRRRDEFDPTDPDLEVDPDPEDPPPPPPPAISTPDLALQLFQCLDPSLNDDIASSVRAALAANADVRTACINGTQRIAVWLRPAVNNRDNQAREAGLAQLDLLAPSEQLAFFINSSLLRRGADKEWNETPKRRNGDGDPDPNGPIHLGTANYSFEGPNKIVTRIDGFDERPWPDVNFQLIITDTLVATNDGLDCETQPELDVDTSWLTFLTVLLFALRVPLLPIVFLVQRLIVGSRDAPENLPESLGQAALDYIPKEILIPGGKKVVATYRRINVSEGGVFAGGWVEILDRRPEVTINGPRNISVAEGSPSVSRTYTLRTHDLRPPFDDPGLIHVLARVVGTGGTTGPIGTRAKIEWGGQGVPRRPRAESTLFDFDLSGMRAGDVNTFRISVRVVDSDGLSASDELTVTIHMTPAVDEDGDFPPVCRNKPWLPECEQAMLRARGSRGRRR